MDLIFSFQSLVTEVEGERSSCSRVFGFICFLSIIIPCFVKLLLCLFIISFSSFTFQTLVVNIVNYVYRFPIWKSVGLVFFCFLLLSASNGCSSYTQYYSDVWEVHNFRINLLLYSSIYVYSSCNLFTCLKNFLFNTLK